MSWSQLQLQLQLQLQPWPWPWSQSWVLPLSFVVGLTMLAGSENASAQQTRGEIESPRAPPLVVNDRLEPDTSDEASTWRLQGRAELEIDQRRNRRLDRDRNDRRVDVEPLVRLGVTYRASRHVFGFVETALRVRHREERRDPTETLAQLLGSQAYVGLVDLLPDTRVQIGRWLYRDEREWLFDESLDGALLRLDRDRIEADLMAARVNRWRRDLFDAGTRGEPVNFYGLLVRVPVDRRFKIGGYAVVRHDTTGVAGRQRHLGLRAHGRSGNWTQWTELGIVDGEVGQQRLRGHVLDVGGVYMLRRHPLRPRLLVGYAFASGDDDAGDGVDRRYRQTGLQSNEARLEGLVKRRIYGEAFDPELSNLRIRSLGIGFAPTPQWSVDLVWHDYRQDKLGPVARAGIVPRHDGMTGRALGQEVDLIVGYAPKPTILLTGAIGWFEPAARFRIDRDQAPNDPGRALFARVELRVRF
ncbi:MAG: alginate export family protein [Burkholderiaceae bacterium]